MRRAATELEELRRQNRRLSSRDKRRQREAARTPADESAWKAEKLRVRDRLERLVAGLEGLL